MSLPGDASLSLDQAPPLAIPASFFLLAPAMAAGAGLLLVLLGIDPLESGGRPASRALTHLGTLGFVGSAMLGALYQMIPVVAGARVPLVRVAYGVFGLWALGVGLLVAAFLQAAPGPLWHAAGGALGLALLGFLLPVGLALLRAPAQTATRVGMGFAVGGLVLVALLGMAFVALRGADWIPPGYHPVDWRVGHLGLGLAVWIGGLLVAVSWQVLPMFYLAEEIDPSYRVAVTACAGLSLLAVPIALMLGTSASVVGALLPATLAAWVAHPALVAPSLRRRRRKRRDESLTAWFAALACAPLTALLGLAALTLPSPRWDVAFLLVAVWGWAGFAIHGMLCRIVPFLVWFHRLSPHVGILPVPSMRKLLPQDRIRRGLIAHGTTLALALAAVMTGVDGIARLAGLGFVVTAAALGSSLVSVLRVRAPATVDG